MRTKGQRKIVVSVAPVGRNISPPSINPLTPEEIAEEVIASARIGASMVHLHVRDREGSQTEDLTEFSRTLDLIMEGADIIIQGSTGGLSTLSLEERCVSLNDPRVEVASLNMGSVNFGENVYINTLPDIRFWAKKMEETDIIPELEIFEGGMIANVSTLLQEKTLSPPLYYNFCLGFHGALPAHPENLFFLKNMLPEGALWGVVHDGMNDLSLLATGLGVGASVVRIGFEDSVYYAAGKAAETNAELVKKIVSLIRHIGCEPASPQEAREILKTKK